MKTILEDLQAYILEKNPEYIKALEDYQILKHGSYESAKASFLKVYKENGDLAFVNALFPDMKWSEEDLNKISKLEDSLKGINSFLCAYGDTPVQKIIDFFKNKDKSLYMRNILLSVVGVIEWSNTKRLSLESLSIDIGMSKNTFREKWLPFFFGAECDDTLHHHGKPHKFHGRRKITPSEYLEIWKEFVVQPKIIEQSKLDMLTGLKQNWSIKKSDLKTAFKIRSKALQYAIEDAQSLPEYPKNWGVIPASADKFPYSVALLIANELELTSN